MKHLRAISIGILALLLAGGCVTQKKKNSSVGWFRKGYHNLTHKYNYWFNADELLNITIAKQNAAFQDNYNQVLPIYPYAAADPQPVKADLENVMKKAAKGIALHRVSDWTDDCYTIMGQAQFIKRDFETAEETFKYIQAEYNPSSKLSKKSKVSDGKKKPLTKKQKKKAAKKKKKENEKKKKLAAKRRKENAERKKKGLPPLEDPAAKPASGKAQPVKNKEDDDKTKGHSPYQYGIGKGAAFPMAMLWFARTLTEREKYSEAEFLFRQLQEDPYFPGSLVAERSLAEAQFWIKQKRYNEAIVPLTEAIKRTRRKKDRARPAFILAQLYERAERYPEAFAAYETVLNSAPAYTMEFNARLHQIESGWQEGRITSADATKRLERMARDEKNKEFRDQVYFSLASIALKDNLRNEAIAYLRQSLNFNVNNASQKSESFLKLADLYFEAESFVQAKAYYDSTLAVLDKTDERYERVNNYATNLTDIARLLTTIAANDSIVRLYRMGPDERREVAKTLKQQQQAQAQADAKKAIAQAQAGPGKSAGPPLPAANKSAFYFYNESFVKKGRRDFVKAWGERKLEDNWSRSLRPGAVAGAGNDASGADTTQAGGVSDSEVNELFKGLPANDAELSVLHLATYEAMYNLGVLFREKLQNNVRSLGTLEEMQSRYPDTAKYEKEAWYYCYLDCTDLNKLDKAQYYYDKLVGKYPNSTYARVLSDPNFLSASRERERELARFYEDAYAMFKGGQYQPAFDKCAEAPKKFGSTNPMMAKFALLGALCIGNLQGQEGYCKALSEVIGRYPESAEATRAREIARVLACKGFEVAATKKNEAGAGDDTYVYEEDKQHYFLVSLQGDNLKLENIKNAISDYNREYHGSENLRVLNAYLGTDTNNPLFVVRKFDNKAKAMGYLNEVRTKKDFLGETEKRSYNKEFFVVTQDNYRRILKNKSLEAYRPFFEENYK